MTKKEENKKAVERTKRLVAIRVRGDVHMRKTIKDTLTLLNLNHINHCVVIDDRPQYKGMLQKVKDYVTWGEVSEQALTTLLEKRGRIAGNGRIDDKYVKDNSSYKSIKEFAKALFEMKAELKDVAHVKAMFRLKPPSKGYERAGIKKPYSLGGALGYRKQAINELLQKMN